MGESGLGERQTHTALPVTVAISGGVGVGKTTLGKCLVELNPRYYFFEDDVKRNPYLARFYEDMTAWSFHSRISFLALKSEIYREFNGSFDVAIIDRCVHELDIFASIQHDLGNMTEDEYAIYRSLHDSLLFLVPEPDLILYVNCSIETALSRIRLRARPYEQGIDAAYLKMILERYEKWIAELSPQKVIMVNTDQGSDLLNLALRISDEIARLPVR